MICPKCNSKLYFVGDDYICIKCDYTQKKPTEKKIEETQKYEEMLKIAQRKYFSLTYSTKDSRSYLEERGLKRNTITKFGIGYCGPFGSKLQYTLLSKGFTEDEMLAVGIIGKSKKDRLYEKLSDRIIFPIYNVDDKLIGFGGRALRKETNTGVTIPKYWNSPESAIFKKRENLYALNIAHKSTKDFFILCEGYMDVIALHQAGYDNAIASLGTALTSEQVSLIKKYKKIVYLAYDSDEAGKKAAKKAISLLRPAGITVRVINLAPAKDPDELIKTGHSFGERIATADSCEHYLFFNSKEDKYGILSRLLIS